MLEIQSLFHKIQPPSPSGVDDWVGAFEERGVLSAENYVTPGVGFYDYHCIFYYRYYDFYVSSGFLSPIWGRGSERMNE